MGTIKVKKLLQVAETTTELLAEDQDLRSVIRHQSDLLMSCTCSPYLTVLVNLPTRDGTQV